MNDMNQDKTEEMRGSENDGSLGRDIEATAMSPLELNGIRLDANHTVLTPDYLEKIKTQNQSND